MAHTNDLGEESEPQLVAVEWRVPGEPVVLSIGIGPWLSVGWNDAGLSLTGNELTPNDERVGVPRLLMVREQLTARSLDEAVAMALRPDRASSYNTVLAHRDGRLANVEGSAGDALVREVEAGGTLAHTNHYVEPAMLRYEGGSWPMPAARPSGTTGPARCFAAGRPAEPHRHSGRPPRLALGSRGGAPTPSAATRERQVPTAGPPPKAPTRA